MVDKTPVELPKNIPQHIAIIMDGNGRWARSRGLPRIAGHRAGTENIRQIIKACVEFGVKYLTVYAFSTENWGRPQEEVSGLMRIFEEVFVSELDELHEEGVRLIHVGHMENVSPSLIEKVDKAIELTRQNDQLVLGIAFNYGSRDEIVHAVQDIIRDGISPEKINENVISSHLFTADMPDPDLVIRTSGEYRTSNFLLWQTAYSEWIFSPEYWPDFGRDKLLVAIHEFSQRDRRYGLVK
ncbi:MAG: isoprenyl transferase [Anaerolineales bacterium]|nr:isoprenyl transferase [Anaerolineales bacterium]